MRFRDRKKMKSFERALFSLGRPEEKTAVEGGDDWQAGVMSHIRALGSLNVRPRRNSITSLNRLVWRFAAVALLLCLTLFVSYFGFSRDGIREDDPMAEFTDDPDGLIVTQP